MHSYPVVGLVIHTDHSELIEKMLHNALRLAGRAVPGSPGTEWFHTTPDAVRAWYLAFVGTLPLLGGAPERSQGATSGDGTPLHDTVPSITPER